MLWSAIKLATLKKIDPSINSLVPERKTKDYLNAMVETINRGLEDLATAGKYITKKITITQNPIKNILPDPLLLMNIYQHLNDDVSYSATGAKAYYFEVNGTATIQIKLDDVVIETIENTVKGKYTAYRKKVSNPTGKTLTINFTGPYPYQYRNVAMYDVTFETDADVCDFVSEKRYNMRSLAADFYKLVPTDIVLQAGFNERRYEKTDEYYWEGDSVLVLNGQQKGEWTVHYYAYPKEVTINTPDTEDISLDPEVAQLLIIFAASELYEDENVSKAQYWREQYESGKAQLNPTQIVGKQAVFVDSQGWG